MEWPLSPRHLRSLLRAEGWFFVWSFVVLFVSCVCVCDLFLFLYPTISSYSQISSSLSIVPSSAALSYSQETHTNQSSLHRPFLPPPPPLQTRLYLRSTFDRCYVRGGGSPCGRLWCCPCRVVCCCSCCVFVWPVSLPTHVGLLGLTRRVLLFVLCICVCDLSQRNKRLWNRYRDTDCRYVSWPSYKVTMPVRPPGRKWIITHWHEHETSFNPCGVEL